jgi:hypothetical protein
LTPKVCADREQRRGDRVRSTKVIDAAKRDVVHGMQRGSFRGQGHETVNVVVVRDAVEVDGESG